MLNKKVADAINEQINKELYSAYLYLEMANYYHAQGLGGFGHYFEVQAQEERDHAMYFRAYLLHRNAPVVSKQIDTPKADYNSLREPLVEQLTHEQFVTRSIEDILELALEEKDYATQEFLQWFIKEQAEEESNAENMLDDFDFVDGDKIGIYMYNKGLGKRQYAKGTPDID